MKKKLIVLRGLPGSGKSTKAAQLAKKAENPIICSTDDFFVKEGKYTFVPELLHENHKKNMDRVIEALTDLTHDLIIVDNTNVKAWEYKRYLEEATKRRIETQVVVVGMPCTEDDAREYARRNTHGVPEDKVVQMWRKFQI